MPSATGDRRGARAWSRGRLVAPTTRWNGRGPERQVGVDPVEALDRPGPTEGAQAARQDRPDVPAGIHGVRGQLATDVAQDPFDHDRCPSTVPTRNRRRLSRPIGPSETRSSTSGRRAVRVARASSPSWRPGRSRRRRMRRLSRPTSNVVGRAAVDRRSRAVPSRCAAAYALTSRSGPDLARAIHAHRHRDRAPPLRRRRGSPSELHSPRKHRRGAGTVLAIAQAATPARSRHRDGGGREEDLQLVGCRARRVAASPGADQRAVRGQADREHGSCRRRSRGACGDQGPHAGAGVGSDADAPPRGLQGRRRTTSEPQPAAWGRTPRRALPSASRPVSRAARAAARFGKTANGRRCPMARPTPARFYRETAGSSPREPTSTTCLRPWSSRRSPTATSAGATWSRREPGWVERVVIDEPETSSYFTPLSICLNVDSFRAPRLRDAAGPAHRYTLVEGDERVVLEYAPLPRSGSGEPAARPAGVRHQRLSSRWSCSPPRTTSRSDEEA